MANHGSSETDKLKQNMEEQMERLVAQLADLEEMKEDLDDDEYKETKDETLEQLVEFQESLAKATNGDMSLVNAFGAIQLAIQATVSSAFKNPEVIRMMGKREPGQLRDRIGDLDAKVAIGEITEDARNGQVVEILTAIRKLGGKISAEESAFLESNGSDELNQFEAVSSSLAGEDALKLAGAGVSAAN